MLSIAIKIKSTYYDAAYVVTASEEDLTLVTDDKRLIRKINDNKREIVELLRRNVVVKSSDAFIGENRQ